MTFIESIIALGVILSINLLINRIATVALVFTGVSREMARFQARSAFCTVGFTTNEAESIVNHPVRRRIVMILMLAGNVGFVSTMVTASTSMQSGDSALSFTSRLLLFLGMLAGIWAVGTSRWVDDALFKIISKALRTLTRLEAHDYLTLLQFGKGYCITEIPVEPKDWMADHTLTELRMADEGVTVIAVIRPNQEFLGSPAGKTKIQVGDQLIVYGLQQDIARLDGGRQDPVEHARHKQRMAVAHTMRMQTKARPEEAQAGLLTEILVDDAPALRGRTLGEIGFAGRGVGVAGVQRADGAYVAAPDAGFVLQSGDRIVCHGTLDDLRRVEREHRHAPREGRA